MSSLDGPRALAPGQGSPSYFDRAIYRSKQTLKILWSLVVLVIVVFLFLYCIKRYRKKGKHNPRKTLRSLLKKDSKSAKGGPGRSPGARHKEEDTTMMVYPTFSLEEPAFDYQEKRAEILSSINTDAESSYTYDDLKKVIEDEDESFYKEYHRAVKKALSYKKKRYLALYQEKANSEHPEDEVAKLTKPLRKTVDVCKRIEEIIELITEQQKNLSVEQIKDNFKDMLWNKSKGLETLIERRQVQDLVAKQIFAFKKHQIHFFTSHQNGLILGNSGLGKTKIGQCLAHAFSRSGIMTKDTYVCISADQLKSPYVDDTAKVCREFFEDHLEEVVLLEEIYGITPSRDGMLGDMNRSHGQEAINVLVALTDEYKGLCRTYGIGYRKPTMKRFIEPNEGMARRFPLVITLGEYSNKGLTQILIRFLASNSGINVTPKEAAAIYGMIIDAKREDPKVFNKEAGDMENLASDISAAVYNSRSDEWIEGDYNNNIKLLIRGFVEFVNKKKNALTEPAERSSQRNPGPPATSAYGTESVERSTGK